VRGVDYVEDERDNGDFSGRRVGSRPSR
jgi:hypothetical protein